MSIKVKCPNCTKTLTVPDAAKGKAVKCPSCETRVSIPADDDAAAVKSSAGKSGKKPKQAAPIDDESGLAGLDLRKVADHEANVCPKCGYDLDAAKEDEDDVVTECPQCGWDVEEGGMGAKARKKALKGPDPDKFYPGLWKNSWKFVGVNLMLAIRTFLYTLLGSVISGVAALGYLYFSMLPPRYMLFAPLAIVAALVVPGWIWYLDTEVIKLTLERRDKFKRVNFDFFLAGALGVKFVVWNFVFAGPLLALPGLIAWVLFKYAGLPSWIIPLTLGVSYVPIIGLWPVTLTHMTMPIESPGWMFWKVIPMAFRCFKPLLWWFTLFCVTTFPIVLIMGTTFVFTGGALVDYIDLMEQNAEINRAQTIWDDLSGSKMKPKDLVDPKTLGELRKVETRHYIALGATAFAWLISLVILAITSLFNMRTNGWFSYYFRDRLDLQLLVKEYKYVASLPRGNEKKIKTTGDVVAESAVAVVIFMIIGVIIGGLVGALNDQVGIAKGLVGGVFYGAGFAGGAAGIGMLIAAFGVSPVWGLLIFFSGCMCGIPHIVFLIQEWEEAKQFFFQWLFAVLIQILMFPIMIMMAISPIGAAFQRDDAPQNQQGPMDPAVGPGAMPGGPAGVDPAKAAEPGAGAGPAIPANAPPAGTPAGAAPGVPKPGG